MEAYDLREKIQEAALFSFEEGSPEPFEALDRLLEAVEETRQTQGLAEISGEALSQQPLDPVRYYLHGFALVKLGQADQATKVLQSLCSRLEQEGKWGLLGRLLPRILDAAPSVEVARCLAKAGETAGVGQLDPEAIEKAYTLYPDEERLAYLMGELEAQRNEGERALDYWADSLDGFVGLRRYDRLEEALLKVAASENPEHQAHVVHVLKRLAEQNQWNRFGSFLEIAHDGLLASGQLPEVWKIVLNHFAKAPEEAGLRKWIRQLAPEVFPAAEGILDLLGRSGILDAQMRAETALKQLQTLLEFAPGFHVLHDSWGIGRIRLNDGDTLVVDFRTTKNHRMKLTLARRALTVIPPDDLRVLHSEDPAELKRLLRENPSEVIVRALRTMKGEATTQDLRRNLVGQGIVSAGSWTSWWKEARASLESDDRIDLTQSFRQLYRLKTEAADEDRMPLPAIEPKRGIRPNLNLIRRFLEQHPDEAGRAARLYTPILERWAKDDRTSAEDKMAVGLQLERWRQEIRADFMDALRACLESNVEMSSFADLEDQKLLTRVALENEGLWKRGAVMALSSRSPEVREMARERMRQDPEESRSVLNELLADPIERPLASLAAFDLTLEDPPEPFAPDPWLTALAATQMVDAASKEPLRKQALAWLSPSGPLAAKLQREAVPPGNAERWLTMLRRWRSSERYLQPVLAFLNATGQEGVVQEVRSAHAERTDRILGAAASNTTDYRGHLMTRGTYRKVLHERNWLVQELKTTLPKTIQKARELGDLSENAEYHSAKMKQADFARRAVELTERLARARIIEDMKIPSGEAAPGTEIEVLDVATNQPRIYWLLGEGDDWIASNVISYAAPLGRSLLGKKVGDRVSVIGSDAVHELSVRSVKPKLPQPEAVGVAEEQEPEPEVSEQEVSEIVRGIEQEDGAGSGGNGSSGGAGGVSGSSG